MTQKPPTTPSIPDRASQVLADVVTIHHKTGTPVGSKALTEESLLNLSGASFRNVMQDLEKMGFLTQPHTSAGRVPTQEGYRYYAQTLLTTNDIATTLKKDLKSAILGQKDMTQAIKNASHLLQEMTGCTSLITAPTHNNDSLDTVEFIRLSGDRVLVVMVTATGTIENRIIEVPAFISAEELNKASADLKKVIAGQTLEGARDQMIASLAEQKAHVNTMIDQMMSAAHEWGEPIISDGAMVVAVSTNLFQYPELVREKLQGLVKIFEEKRLLMTLMEEVKQGTGVKVFIGTDNPLSDDTDCSIIANSFGKNAHLMGTVGVIGPNRMDYKQTIGLVNYTSQLLTQAMTPTTKA